MSAKIRNQIMNTFSNYKILKDVRKKAEAARQDENRPHEILYFHKVDDPYSHLTIHSIEKLKSSDELFATSTAGGIMPITKINGKPVGSGVPGKITRKLHKIYWDKHSNPDWSLSVDDILIK